MLLEVPEGQLHTGQLLVQCMYRGSQHLNLGQVPQQQLLELLLLADRYQASAIAMIAAEALGSKTAKDMEWQVGSTHLHAMHSVTH